MLGESAIQGEHGALDVTAPSDRRMGVLFQFELLVSTTPTPPLSTRLNTAGSSDELSRRFFCEAGLKGSRGVLLKILSGTLSETRNNSQYVGHWRIAENVLMVKLGMDVETLTVDARLNNPEAIARQLFERMIARYEAKK